MRFIFAFAALATLAACGADGPPTAPTTPGLNVSGDVGAGVSVTN